MKIVKKLVLLFATIFVVAMAASARADPGQPIAWYDTFGFEPPGFALGPIGGQGNWPQALPPGIVATQAGGGTLPTVIQDTTGAGMGQIVKFLTVAQGDGSGIDVFFPSPIKNGNTIVEIEFDMYRTELNVNNFWWWTPDAGDYTYGLEWDQSLAVHPFGWSPGAGQTPATLNGWDHIALEWDFGTSTVSSWVNGLPVDVALPFGANPPADVTGFSLWFAHDGALGPQVTTAYVDNLRVSVDIVPEPGTIALLASGLMSLLFVLRRRVK